jgi:hypothetical protein
MSRKIKQKKRAPLSTQVPMSWKGTATEWRMHKRVEWQQITRAMEQFAWGCAYVPVGTDFFEMQRAAQRISEAMAEDWVFG